jgi:hypothetical protein
LQATLQHTPSVQKPDAHSGPFAHLEPLTFRPQLPATHFVPLQSTSEAHVAMHAPFVESHWNGLQIVVGPALHRPLPSQTMLPETAAPSQAPALHTVPAACLRHAPAPSQVPSRPHDATSVFGQSVAARGAAPDATSVHVPGEPGALHVLQVSPHATLQQTPSAQKPLAQSPAQPQAWPFGFRAAPAPLQGTCTAIVSTPPSRGVLPFGPQLAASEATKQHAKQKMKRSPYVCGRVGPATIESLRSGQLSSRARGI